MPSSAPSSFATSSIASPSFAAITRRDLARLARLAQADRVEFFERHPEWEERYGSAVLVTVLTDEAANHYGSGLSGFSDFRLYTFYSEYPGAPYPPGRRSCLDFGPSRHGRETQAPETFTGRQVWLEGRSISSDGKQSLLDLLQLYLKSGATPTARRLRNATVVFVEPKNLLGIVAWPTLVVAPKIK